MRYIENLCFLRQESTPENVIQCHLTILTHNTPVFKRELLFDDPKIVPASSFFWGKERLCLRMTQLGSKLKLIAEKRKNKT